MRCRRAPVVRPGSPRRFPCPVRFGPSANAALWVFRVHERSKMQGCPRQTPGRSKRWRVGVSPEDIEARFIVRWLTKTKKEIHHYTNQALLSTSTSRNTSLGRPPELLAHVQLLTLCFIGNGEWRNGLMEIGRLHGTRSSPGTQQFQKLWPGAMLRIP